MNITLIDFRNNPDLRLALETAARRDRARKIGELVGKGLAYLAHRESPHAPRTHFARQG